MKILVTGGAGYIGSHTCVELLNAGYDVVVLDNLSNASEKSLERVSKITGKPVKFYKADILDRDALNEIFDKEDIDSCIHFAGLKAVGESVAKPWEYYENNIAGTLTLVDVMRKHNVKNIVFSSTAATYGEPENIPILETDRTFPTNPYGESKLAVEKMMKWCDVAYGIKFTALRYFNVAGAHPTGEIGEDHNPESHLIPIILQVALGKRESIGIYGDDYPTPDGTCIRDYIHVMDLADAHILALKRLYNGGESAIFNLGNGEGFSVKEVIEVTRKVTGHPIPAVVSPRRAGDPAKLVATSEKAMRELNWKPKYNSLEKIIETAWNWHKSHPNGYED